MLIWIVGSRGMLGKELARLCRQKNIPYHATDREECDITNLDELKRKAEGIVPTHIVNCAAYTYVDGAENEQEKAHLINAKGPFFLSLVAKGLSAKLIHISTDYVFNGEGGHPYLEEEKCDPLNIYGKSKWEGEKSAFAHDSTACVIRTSWLFGRGGKNFLSSLLKLLCSNDEVSIVEDQVSKPTFVSDLAQAILDLRDCSGIFHFANGDPISRFQMAQDVLAAAKSKGLEVKCRSIYPTSLSSFPAPAKRPLYTALDTTKVTQTLGKAPRSWEEVLNDFLRNSVKEKTTNAS